MIRRVGRGFLLALRVVLMAGLLLVGGVGLWDGVSMYRLTADFRLAQRCNAGETGDCLSEELAIVREDGRFWNVRVGLDDNRRVEGLFLRGLDEPQPGTRVVAQSWNNTIVALRDPSTETVYRTEDWPIGWEWFEPVFAAFVLVLGVAVAPRESLRRLFRKLRRAGPVPG